MEHEIHSGTPQEAYETFIDSNKPLSFTPVSVSWGLFGAAKIYHPPHYEGHKSNEEVEKEL
jgi:hypothetical protein